MNSTPSLLTPEPTVPRPQRVFFPNLDGLRFLAFLAVFLFHSFYTTDANIVASTLYKVPHRLTRDGHFGVNFFFVLSGYLITYLLLEEKRLNGKIAIGAFYMRRILRIWPLYFVVVFIGFIILPWFKMHFGQTVLHETAHPWYFFLFLVNFNNLYYGSQTPTLTLLWSVSVEEQFYLIWPLLIAAVPMKRLGWLFGGVLSLSLAFRLLNMHNSLVLDSHTFSLIGDMALGGMTAWLCFRNNKLVNYVILWPRWVIGLGYIAGITLIAGNNWLGQMIPSYVVFDRLVLARFLPLCCLSKIMLATHS